MKLATIKKLPTATASESRLRLFQPTQRPKRQTIVVEGPWGKAKITGRLGQRHADLIEIVRAKTRQWGVDPAGRVAVLVDPHTLRKELGGGNGQYSHERMYSLFRDLRETTIEIETSEFMALGGLLDEVVEAITRARNPLTGEERPLMKVTFGRVGTELLAEDLFLYYNPAPIAALTSGMSQAVARHLLTHSKEPNGGWRIDTLIRATAGDIDGASLRKARLAIRKDAYGLAQCGIIVDGDRVRRARGEG